MLSTALLPPQLQANLGSESLDFVTKAGRRFPRGGSLGAIVMGLVWIAFILLISLTLILPIMSGGEVVITSNGVANTATAAKLGPIMGPAIFLGVFLLIGLMIFWSGVYSLFAKGGYFAGTPIRLVISHKNSIRSIDWEQFSGDINVRGNGQQGTISMQLRTGKMVSQKNGPDRFVPEVIHLVDIAEVSLIESMCRQRIKENDPTPAQR